MLRLPEVGAVSAGGASRGTHLDDHLGVGAAGAECVPQRAHIIRPTTSPRQESQFPQVCNWGVHGTSGPTMLCSMGWSDLFDRARSHHGVVTVADGDACGVSRHRLARRATSDGWVRLHRGVWVVAGHPVTAITRLAAATAAAKVATVSHRSSLWLHGVVRAAPRTPHILVPHSHRGPADGQPVRVHRSRTLCDDQIQDIRGLSTTIVERSILDVAAAMRRSDLRNLVIDAQHHAGLSLDTLHDLRRMLSQGRKGLAGLDQVLADLRGGGADSGWEIEVRHALEAVGVIVHPGPFPYRCSDGIVVHLDVAVPGSWVCVELDGRAFHSDRAAFARDRVRWNQISREWRIVWVTWDRWQQERAGVIADILAAIRTANPRRPAAQPAVR